ASEEEVLCVGRRQESHDAKIREGLGLQVRKVNDGLRVTPAVHQINAARKVKTPRARHDNQIVETISVQVTCLRERLGPIVRWAEKDEAGGTNAEVVHVDSRREVFSNEGQEDSCRARWAGGQVSYETKDREVRTPVAIEVANDVGVLSRLVERV